MPPDVAAHDPLERPSPVYTIGHGNRPLEEFIALLRDAGVTCLVDVRAFPGSRRHPHFSRQALEGTLPAAGIDYVWEGVSLGGRRRPRADSPHVALRHPSFRAYADHMQTPDFRAGIERLAERARAAPTAIMCAERLPWQCHRYMISDYLVANGGTVVHLMGPGASRGHRVREEARMLGTHLIYDRNTQDGLALD